jgi:hypothetical protein
MAESTESIRDKLIVAIVQTLIFGVLLALLGYWLNLRLETYKQVLANQSEMNKSLLSSLNPYIQQRLTAYLELQQAAYNVKRDLEIYYYLAKEPSDYDLLEQLHQKISGVSSSSFIEYKKLVSAIEDLTNLRGKYELVLSDKVKSTADDFINTIIKDLLKEPAASDEAFEKAARSRLRTAFDKLKNQITEALGLEQLPLR